MTFAKPRPLTIPEIHDVVQRFAFAADVLHKAGADGIQLHAAHGYLISQFLSPRVNKRTDQYGGDSLENRSRIVFEIIEAIKAKVQDDSCMYLFPASLLCMLTNSQLSSLSKSTLPTSQKVMTVVSMYVLLKLKRYAV